MELTQNAALWFFLLTLPICLYVAFTDLREMRIKNHAVIVLGLIFILIAPLLMSFTQYLWQLSHLVVMLIIGMILNARGAMGAGDAKFIAAAAPYVLLGDVRLIMGLFAAALLAAFTTHRIIKFTPLRQIAPHWESWTRKKFPMGFTLGGTLAAYLGLGVFFGA
ncbi:MAG: prepilin peptidase [Pseudomonadota bacterium]